jgi:hypothetical protein
MNLRLDDFGLAVSGVKRCRSVRSIFPFPIAVSNLLASRRVNSFAV